MTRPFEPVGQCSCHSCTCAGCAACAEPDGAGPFAEDLRTCVDPWADAPAEAVAS